MSINLEDVFSKFYFHFRKEIYGIEIGKGNGFKAVMKFLGY